VIVTGEGDNSKQTDTVDAYQLHQSLSSWFLRWQEGNPRNQVDND